MTRPIEVRILSDKKKLNEDRMIKSMDTIIRAAANSTGVRITLDVTYDPSEFQYKKADLSKTPILFIDNTLETSEIVPPYEFLRNKFMNMAIAEQKRQQGM